VPASILPARARGGTSVPTALDSQPGAAESFVSFIRLFCGAPSTLVFYAAPADTVRRSPVAWYAAHILMRIRYRDGPDEPCYVMENIVLLDAASPVHAKELAHTRGRADDNRDDHTFSCDGRPAYWEFAGVRLVMSCQDEDERPTSGTEVTYLEYRLAGSADLDQLLRGNDVRVEFGG
jgi:hypothetical protein